MKKLLLLQNRYIPVLLIFALFVAFRFYYVNKLAEESRLDTNIINLSGKQRMHSQKTLAMAQAYFIDRTEANKKEYINALEQAQKNRQLLEETLKSRKYLEGELTWHNSVGEHVSRYISLHADFLKNPTKEKLLGLQVMSDTILKSVGNIVTIYSEHANARYERLNSMLYITTSAFLIILVLSALFVFWPASRQITEYTELLTKQKRELESYVSLVDKYVIISSTDLKGNITYVSDAFCVISKYSKAEIIGKNHRIIRHPDMPSEFYKDLWGTIVQGGIWRGEIKNRAKDGSEYWVYAVISPIYDNSNGQKIGYTAIRQDITNKKKIEEISITDGMTGLFNRRYFNEVFPKTINAAKRDEKSVAFLILDVDHFKQYNDTYGHQKGDDVLINIAKTIKDTFKRNGDVCFRLGGEEFGVIFTGNDESTAIEMANKLRENIELLAIEHSKNSASQYVTASMGLSIKNSCDAIDMDVFYKDADELLYKAKEGGRNRVLWG